MTKANLDRVEARLVSRSAALMRGRDARLPAPLAPAVALPAAAERCLDCGGPILLARRAAVPGAVRCVGCQRRFELVP